MIHKNKMLTFTIKMLTIAATLLATGTASLSFADNRDGYRILYTGKEADPRITFSYTSSNCDDVTTTLKSRETVLARIPWRRANCVLKKIVVEGRKNCQAGKCSKPKGSSKDVHNLSRNNLFLVTDDDENNGFKIITERYQEQ